MCLKHGVLLKFSRESNIEMLGVHPILQHLITIYIITIYITTIYINCMRL